MYSRGLFSSHSRNECQVSEVDYGWEKGFHHHSARAENAILMNGVAKASGFHRMTIDVVDCREQFPWKSPPFVQLTLRLFVKKRQ